LPVDFDRSPFIRNNMACIVCARPDFLTINFWLMNGVPQIEVADRTGLLDWQIQSHVKEFKLKHVENSYLLDGIGRRICRQLRKPLFCKRSKIVLIERIINADYAELSEETIRRELYRNRDQTNDIFLTRQMNRVIARLKMLEEQESNKILLIEKIVDIEEEPVAA
jgi:hypothetical protein